MAEQHEHEDYLADLLGDLMGEKPEVRRSLFNRNRQFDAIVDVAGWRFLVEAKVGVTRAALERHLGWATLPTATDREVRLLVVPHMPAGMAVLCAKLQIWWLDEVGNCDVRAPGLRLHVRGLKPDEPGVHRQPGLTSPKAMRFLRYLLFHDGPLVQRDAARAVAVDEAQASRIVRQLLDTGALTRHLDGCLTVRCNGAILDLLARGASTSTTGRHVVAVRPTAGSWTDVAARCLAMAVPHVVSGHAAASLLATSVPAGTCKIWIVSGPNEVPLADIGVELDAGGDIQLCFDDDNSRLEGRAIRQGVCIAHPGQVYLDCIREPLSRSDLAALRALAVVDEAASGGQSPYANRPVAVE